jgi:DNA-binding PadR family transcriptional regulator
MRRKPGTLLSIEVSILDAGIDLRGQGEPEFHGFLVAKRIKGRDEARLLTAHGTLYRALARLEKAGMLASRWEDPQIAAEANRPRRRLYHVTLAGERALAQARRLTRGPVVSPEPRKATT